MNNQEEIAHDILDGIRCMCCEKLLIGESVSCYCKDEVAPFLAAAHVNVRWCNEDCLHSSHEVPKSDQNYEALSEEVDD